ncbi:MAG: HAMP domain-containing sensor histidine kinase [Sedimentisphaerales bacterium]|jgi:signal transduction histidine kinase|nr:HAMP domain-containing sensor histidine kinase [Sedimentisphaerales bacterium]
MFKRLIILSALIGMAVLAAAILGYLALDKWRQGLYGYRLGGFAKVASQIHSDVKQKLDRFIKTEQSRPYTDYYPYHLPDPNLSQSGQVRALIRSPLWGRLDHGLAYGHFQVLPDGSIQTPNDGLLGALDANTALVAQVKQVKSVVSQHLVPLLRPSLMEATAAMQIQPSLPVQKVDQPKVSSKAQSLYIDTLQQMPAESQVIRADRQSAYANLILNSNPGQVIGPNDVAPEVPAARGLGVRQRSARQADAYRQLVPNAYRAQQLATDIQGPVTVKVGPLVPIVLKDGSENASVFDGSVYMVRHVQVGDLQLFQGFRLDASRLIAEIDDSTARLAGQDMGYELSNAELPSAAYAAVLDFGFGRVVLNLLDLDPGLIGRKVRYLSLWYFVAMSLVGLAVALGLAATWHGAWQQMELSRQKDSFISAVSHELRTPLAGIRVCAEMLEKGWVSTIEQRDRYYHNIRLEAERLTRLIENVLDFSRIQQGRQRYHLVEGDINQLLRAVVETARPLAQAQGLEIRTELDQIPPFPFDHDAITQILLNLLDNAVKFGNPSRDNLIIVRTRQQDDFVLIEVEDHGPGIPEAERTRIFRPFYRLEPEATRRTRGVGLGLALVWRFALAHQGFVQVAEARPCGAVFTVGLRR